MAAADAIQHAAVDGKILAAAGDGVNHCTSLCLNRRTNNLATQ